MEEIKTLISLVKDLPHTALWVIAAIFAYKTIIVGSIYGVIRLVVERLYQWAIARKAREVEYKEIRPLLDGICIKAETDTLIAQLHRLRGRGTGIDSQYIHSQSVDWLRRAIDAQIDADGAQAGTK